MILKLLKKKFFLKKTSIFYDFEIIKKKFGYLTFLWWEFFLQKKL